MQILTSSSGYGGLIEVGLWDPALVVVDLDATSFDPIAMLKALCGHPLTNGTRVVAAGRAPSAKDRLPRGLTAGVEFTTLPLDIQALDSAEEEGSEG